MGEDTEVQRSNLPEVTRLEQSSGLPAPSLTFLPLEKPWLLIQSWWGPLGSPNYSDHHKSYLIL